MKGQARYLVGVGAMVFAVVFYALNNFAVSYVLENAKQDMADNFARYESAVHSYTILNDGVNQTANVLNQTEFADTLSTYPGYQDLCETSRGIDRGDEYKIWFTDPYSTVTSSGDCTRDSAGYYSPFATTVSIALVALPSVYPEVMFWGVADGGEVITMQTRVE